MTLNPTSPPEGTVRDWLELRALKTPDRISHLFPTDNSALTWRDLHAQARFVAGQLAGLGTKPGESVALCLPNSRQAIICLFGVLYGGFRATPLNLVAGPEALGYAVSHSKSKVALVGNDQLGLFRSALNEHPCEISIVTVAETIQWPAPGKTIEPAQVSASDHALLMYTSGTTGRPKGVVHSNASLLAGGWTSCFAHALTSRDRALCVLPFFHINGLCVTLMAPLLSGGSVVVCDRFSNRNFWNQCQRYRVTWFSVVPTIISHLLHSDLGPDKSISQILRFGRSASSALAPDIQESFEKRFAIPIIETMGLTETAAQILSNPLPPAKRKIGSPGIAFGNEVAILSESLDPVDPGVSGELAIRGPNTMIGYLDDSNATAAAFTKGGWLRSGDLGHMDADGYVFVTGRLKELIIKGGENIAPREVDEALYAHGDVVEAAAFARPCPRYGQKVEAAVRLRAGSQVTEDELIALCGKKLGTFKSPDRIFMLGELPKGPSGKIQRLKLPELTQFEP